MSPDSLRDVVIEELMDYESSDKDDQGWTNGPREGIPLVDASGRSPNDSISTIVETND